MSKNLTPNPIGLGIITCQREARLKTCLESLPLDQVDVLVVVNDGPTLAQSVPGHLIQNPQNLGVAKSKNLALEYLLQAGCQHLFLLEDDMLIRRADVFQQYIRTAEYTGVSHLMFAYHGPGNRGGKPQGAPQPRLELAYTPELGLALNRHCLGGFCYYTREVLETVGLIDTHFFNVLEHVDFSYQISKAGYTPPYWWWPDILKSTDWIDEQVCWSEESVIRQRPDWWDNIYHSIAYFIEKNQVAHEGPLGVIDLPEHEVREILLKLYYSRGAGRLQPQTSPAWLAESENERRKKDD